MRLKLLGTGNAAGMPLYGCDCNYCVQAAGDRSLQRTPCSALLEVDNMRYLLDAGQMNLADRFPAGSLDGIFITHFHPDHVQGLFHLRWGINQNLPVYTPPDTMGCADLYKHPGILDFQPLKKFSELSLGQLTVTPLPLIHSKPTFGYLFEFNERKIAYLTDTKGMPDTTLELLTLNPPDIMVIDCSFVPYSNNQTHNNLEDVFDLQKQVKSGKTILTHIGHDMDIWLKKNPDALPDNYIAGYDEIQLVAG